MRVPCRVPLLILALALAGCAAQAPRVADAGCTGAARAALAARGVDPATITETIYYQTRAIEAPAIQDRNVWVRSSACRGYFVVRVDGGCEVVEVYTVGDCDLSERRG